MVDELLEIRRETLEPLYAPWEEPNAHQVRADKPGEPAKVVKNRRASPISVVKTLRMTVREWREALAAIHNSP